MVGGICRVPEKNNVFRPNYPGSARAVPGFCAFCASAAFCARCSTCCKFWAKTTTTGAKSMTEV